MAILRKSKTTPLVAGLAGVLCAVITRLLVGRALQKFDEAQEIDQVIAETFPCFGRSQR